MLSVAIRSGGQAAAVALVRDRRSEVAVAHDVATLGERRTDDLRDVLRPIRRHEQCFGAVVELRPSRGRATPLGSPTPSAVSPGSNVATASSASASSFACVDLPEPSPPSRAMKRPRHRSRVRPVALAERSESDREQTGRDDDRAGQPEREPHAGQAHGERSGSRPNRRTRRVEKRLSAPASSGASANDEQEAEAHEGVERAERATAEVVVDGLVQDREAEDVHRAREDAHPQDGEERRQRASTSTQR